MFSSNLDGLIFPHVSLCPPNNGTSILLKLGLIKNGTDTDLTRKMRKCLNPGIFGQ